MTNKTVYKLTDSNLKTYNGFQWEKGVWAKGLSGRGGLCGGGFYHFYHNPLLAILLNPIHANISNPILWTAEAGGVFKDDNGLKGGCTKMRILKPMKIPHVTTVHRVSFALLCAKAVYKDDSFVKFADNWLTGNDRSEAAAGAAALAAEAAAEAAAGAAAWAAGAAAWAAEAAWAAGAAWAAEAAEAAGAAAWAAAGAGIDLISLAEQAMKIS